MKSRPMNQSISPSQPEDTSSSSSTNSVELCAAMTARWQAGERRILESLVKADSRIAHVADVLLDLIECEIDLHRQAGETPPVDEYAKQYPTVAERLRLLAAVEQLFSEAPLTKSHAIADSHSQFATPDLAMNSLLGAYRILGFVGRGGMGAVYKAEHVHLGKLVALKLLSPKGVATDAEIARFRREMKAVGAVRHPNVVEAFDAGSIDGISYIAMEYIEGETFNHLIRSRGPLNLSEACDLTIRAAEALSAVHAKGLVHRDLKPSNLMLSRSGQVKLLDLGLARLTHELAGDSDRTTLGSAIGTPDFMAPEQWDDGHAVDPRCDQYSLGCVLYYLLTGSPPFSSERYPTPARKMRGHLFDTPRSLSEICPNAPVELAAVCDRLLKKAPRDRFKDVAEAIEAMRPFSSLSAAPHMKPALVAAPVILGDGVVGNTTVPISRDLRGQTVARRMRIQQRRTILAVFIGIALLGVIGVWTARERIWPASTSVDMSKENRAEVSVDKKTPDVTNKHNGISAGSAELTGLTPDADGWVDVCHLLAAGKYRLGDGNVNGIHVDGAVVTLDSSMQAQQLWIDFDQFDSRDFRFESEVRVLNPETQGALKFVVWNPRIHVCDFYGVLQHTHEGVCLAAADHSIGAPQVNLAARPVEKIGEWRRFVVEHLPDEIHVEYGDAPPLIAKRSVRGSERCSLDVFRFWKVELRNPRMRVRRYDKAE